VHAREREERRIGHGEEREKPVEAPDKDVCRKKHRLRENQEKGPHPGIGISGEGGYRRSPWLITGKLIAI